MQALQGGLRWCVLVPELYWPFQPFCCPVWELHNLACVCVAWAADPTTQASLSLPRRQAGAFAPVDEIVVVHQDQGLQKRDDDLHTGSW